MVRDVLDRGVRLGPEVALVRIVVLRLGVGAVDHEVADLGLDDLQRNRRDVEFSFIRFRVRNSPYRVVEPLAVHDGRVPDGGAAELVGAHVTAEEHGIGFSR